MQALERFHLALRGAQYAPGSITTYMGIARRFVEFSEKEDGFTTEDALRYQAHMEHAGGNYLHLVHQVLRQFYRAQDQQFNVKLVRRVRESDISRPTLDQQAVLDLVELARSNCTVQQVAFLAVATIYGPRREELARLRADNFTEDTISFPTVKGGEIRNHGLPAEIQQHVHAYGWPEISVWATGQLFKQLSRDADYPVQNGFNWHAIRRGLITGLGSARTNPIAIQQFMGWRQPRYAELTMQSVYTNWSPDEIDAMIYENHPFLEAWN